MFHCNLVFSTTNKFTVRQTCIALRACIYMFDCNLVFSITNKFTVRPICNTLYTCIYKCNCDLVCSTTNKFTLRPICNALYTCIHKFDCYVEFSLVLTSLQLGRFAMLYTHVFTSLIVTLYLAERPRLQLDQLALL